MRRLAVTHQEGHLADRQRLTGDQLGGVAQTRLAQEGTEARLPYLLEGALQLPGRAGERPRDDGHRQRPAVMAQDDRAALPIEPGETLGRARPMDHRRAKRGMTARSAHNPLSERA